MLGLIAVFPTLVQAGRVGQCSALFTSQSESEFVSNIRANELTETIQYVWYPKSEFTIISHVDLAVNGKMWDGTAGFKIKGTEKERERAARMSERGYFSFSLRVTPEEKAQMQSYLQENLGKIQFQMCASGACKAIEANTGITIPFPFSHIPTLSAIYLSLGRLIGYKRIERIDYVGKNGLRNLLSPAVIVEGGIGFGLIVWFTSKTGELIQQVIPIIFG